MKIDEARDKIHAVLQECGKPDTMEGALLTNWVFVAEFMAPDGMRHLIRFDSEDMTLWLRQGLLHDALDNTTWDHEGDED